MDLKQIVAANPGITEVFSQLTIGGHHLVSGVTGSQRALLLDLLVSSSRGPVLFVTANLKDAESILADYEFFSTQKGFLFPGKPTLGGEVDAESHELENQRIHALEAATGGNPCLVAAPATALLELLPPPEHISTDTTYLARGDSLPIEDLTSRLTRLGYQNVERVDAPGQFSRRGEIVDVFPPSSDPCRIEFFDVEVESVRSFDLETQRSQRALTQIRFGPVRLPALNDTLRKRVLDKLADRSRTISPLFLNQLEQDRERFANLQYWPGSQQYIQYMFSGTYGLLDYFTSGKVVVAETPEIIKHLELHSGELMERHQTLLERGRLLPDLQPWVPIEQIIYKWQRIPTLHLGLLMRSLKQFRLAGISGLSFRQVPSFYGQQQLIVDEVRAWLKREATVVIVGAGQQLAQSLVARDIPVFHSEPGNLQRGAVNFVVGSLSSGFELVEQGLVILSLNELTARRQPARRTRKEPGMTAGELQSLVPGEYVVHSSYGIGQFMGVVTRDIAGSRRDYLYIKYAGKDRLYLPTDQVHMLQRYLGGEEKPPKLYALGGGDWQRVKKKVRESVQKLAFDLLALYAKRQSARGHAFAPDTPWQRELEDNFPYQETSDQLKTIHEIKDDMESVRPMDRLLCGDVGYGKTEVALRAAMKAVMDGKQVVILAPTTVLAQQHYRTFSERFAPFPVRVAVLSRFKSAAQQKEIIAAASIGTIDVVIGTHRLLQKDVVLPNLGLLVVDEEQRFGVEHKEKIKQLKADVDILTMTATPIPRTLHMALLGIRDLSVINTPPEGRFPVQTYVMEYADQLAVYAVRRELDRGGQVYLVYNRVQGIDSLASRLRKLLPGMNLGVIHAQMPEGLLEKTMVDFYEGKYHILLSTTIIENGLDISNVNTVLVYDADRLGLSQLYQLRGRVGRGRRLAYAYFTYRKDKALSEKAQKRLAAIKEFTELGAGYKISLRDLEIRGAGNILGPEQHGFIAAVGFDLYCQLLEQQVRELTGQAKKEKLKPEVNIELPVIAYIPDGYMPEQEKIYVYRRIKDAEDVNVIDDLQDELADRFGNLPQPVETLLDIGRIRIIAVAIGVESITWANDPLTGSDKVRLNFQAGQGPPAYKLQDIWSQNKGKYDFSNPAHLSVFLKTEKNLMLAELEQLLHVLTKNCH
jgi:transcription-repair coupling factor (superfamily II helicase)